jgi:hypothetical protein
MMGETRLLDLKDPHYRLLVLIFIFPTYLPKVLVSLTLSLPHPVGTG